MRRLTGSTVSNYTYIIGIPTYSLTQHTGHVPSVVENAISRMIVSDSKKILIHYSLPSNSTLFMSYFYSDIY